MQQKCLLTEDQEEAGHFGNNGPKGIYSKSRIKARTKQNLWNVKQERPELWKGGPIGSMRPKAGTLDEVVVPVGFESCEHTGWFHDPAKGLWLDSATGRRLWFDKAANEYRELHQGSTLTLVCTSGAARSSGSGSATTPAVPQAVCAGGASSGSTAPAVSKTLAKNINIPDLHRTAQALKMDLGHLDQPSAFLAAFGVATGARAAPTEAAPPRLHEKLIRRLAAFRCQWTDEALCKAVSGALEDIAAEHSLAQPLASVALMVGHRIITAAAPGTSSHLISRSSSSSSTPASLQGRSPGAVLNAGLTMKVECHKLTGSSTEAICIALGAGNTRLTDVETGTAAMPMLSAFRPRAASLAVLAAARKKAVREPLAVACASLCPAPEIAGASSSAPPAKRQRTDEAPVKIRVRQILLLHWKGVGPEPVDPIRRTKVCRTSEEAELQMLKILDDLTQGDCSGKALCSGFSNSCKAHSECESARKGGELSGDLGWLDREKGKMVQQANAKTLKTTIPPLVLKAAFDLEVGQLGDLISSDIGIHLLMRSA